MATRRILDAEPIPVWDWPLLKEEIEQMYEPVFRSLRSVGWLVPAEDTK
jgi:hypothetical protein